MNQLHDCTEVILLKGKIEINLIDDKKKVSKLKLKKNTTRLNGLAARNFLHFCSFTHSNLSQVLVQGCSQIPHLEANTWAEKARNN